MTGREHPGLCDARAAVAFHPPPPRLRWLSPRYRLARRMALVYLAFAAGFALAWSIK